MQNFASISPGRSKTCGVELFRLWDVNEDPGYQIKRVWDAWEGASSTMPTAGRTGLCAARTVHGEGWITTTDGRRQTLGPESLVVLPWLELSGWGTSADAWRFYWFEFFADELEPFLLPDAVQIPLSSTERDETTAIQSQIRSPLTPSRVAASARFSAMLYRWLELASIEPTSQHRYEQVEKAIELMHHCVNQQLSVGQMAAEAGLAARAFTAVFEQATGQTPKRYHLNLRLDAARNLLLSGQANVKETASQLGFSSPFYLSKLYTKRFGHPPSDAH
jgi:AraC-like DNA-binding protein